MGIKEVNIAFVCALMILLLGVGLELLQSFIPGRSFSFVDMIANIFGVILGVLFGKYLRSYFAMSL